MNYFGSKKHLLDHLKSAGSDDVTVIDVSGFDQSGVLDAERHLAKIDPVVLLVPLIERDRVPGIGDYCNKVDHNIELAKSTFKNMKIVEVPRCPQDWSEDFNYALDYEVLCLATELDFIAMVSPSTIAQIIGELDFADSTLSVRVEGQLIRIEQILEALSIGSGKEIRIERTDPQTHLELITPFLDENIARNVLQAHCIALDAGFELSSARDSHTYQSARKEPAVVEILRIVQSIAKEHSNAQ